MQIKVVFFLLGLIFDQSYGDGDVVLPGGGVVSLGQDVEFNYANNEEWFMCSVYRYDPAQSRQDDVEPENCSYVNREGEVSQLKCDPESFGDHLQYTGTSGTDCTVTIKNITMKDEVSWGVRLASDLEPTKFDITVAVATENVSIEAPTVFMAGTPTNVSCVATGGSPKPIILLAALPPLETPINADSLIETFDESLQQRRFTALITPDIKDNGKEFQCTAQQFDNSPEPKELFGKFTADPVTMDVTFTPQPIGDEAFKAKIGEDVLVGIEFLSNPAVDTFSWVNEVQVETQEQVNATTDDVISTPLVNGDKYLIGDLVDLGNFRYRADLTIKMVTEEDIKANYQLMLTNSIGKVAYDFELTSHGGIPEVVSSNLTMFIFIGVGCILILIVIAVAVYKRCVMRGNETAPLMS